MTIGIVKVFLLYNRIGQVNLSVLEANVFQASFLPAPKVEMMERTRFWTFLSTSQKYIEMKIFQPRLIVNFLSLLPLIIHKLGLVNKGN